MFESGSATQRLFQFVRYVRTNKYTFPVCHKKDFSCNFLNGGNFYQVMKRVYKPNLVSRSSRAAIIHLGRALPHGSSGLPGNAAGSLRTSSGQLE